MSKNTQGKGIKSGLAYHVTIGKCPLILSDMIKYDQDPKAYITWYAIEFDHNADARKFRNGLKFGPYMLAPTYDILSTVILPKEVWDKIWNCSKGRDLLPIEGRGMFEQRGFKIKELRYKGHFHPKLLKLLGKPRVKKTRGWYVAYSRTGPKVRQFSEEFVPEEKLVALINKYKLAVEPDGCVRCSL